MPHRFRVALIAATLALASSLHADVAAVESARLKTIELMIMRGQVDESIEAAEAWTESEPASADAWYMLGRTTGNKASRANIFSAAGLAGDSREAYEKALELDPGHVRARYDLIQFYMMAPGIVGGDEDKAVEMAAALEKIDPLWGHLGRAYLAARAKDIAGAEKQYRAALAIDPVHPQSLNALISLLIGTERQDEVPAVAEQALAKDAANAVGHYHLARHAAITGKDLESGLGHIDQFLALTEIPAGMSFAAAHWRRGLILEQLGRKDDALAALGKAVAMDADLEEAQADLKRLRKA